MSKIRKFNTNIGCDNYHDCVGCRYYHDCANDILKIEDTIIDKNIETLKKVFAISNKQLKIIKGKS